MKGRVIAVSISKKKGQKKRNVDFVELKQNFGIIGDAHAGGKRQVSLLAKESIKKIRQKGLDVKPGDFAENITTEGADLFSLKVGMQLKVSRDVLLEVSQIGKDCHRRCSIFYQAGDCIMPQEGVFAKVISGGVVKPGDELRIIDNTDK